MVTTQSHLVSSTCVDSVYSLIFCPLPTASIVLIFSPYRSFDQLKEKVLFAIEETEGFGNE